jgi:hypothetical protein
MQLEQCAAQCRKEVEARQRSRMILISIDIRCRNPVKLVGLRPLQQDVEQRARSQHSQVLSSGLENKICDIK